MKYNGAISVELVEIFIRNEWQSYINNENLETFTFIRGSPSFQSLVIDNVEHVYDYFWKKKLF